MKMTRPLPVIRVVLLLGIWCIIAPTVSGQFCDSITPTFTVDLSASPYQSWISPDTDRDGYCCGASAPDKCLEFVITLHPDAAAIVFNIASGAVPPGALFYQIDCGPPIAVGSPICLTGVGPFHLTFCKPGNNSNTFSIETIPNPTFGPNITLGNGCTGILFANFYDESTVTWTSVVPGAPGAYNSFLGCTAACDTVTVTGQPAAPATVGYLVCGLAANGCIPDPVCDTIFTTFIPAVAITFNAPDTVLCYDETTLPVEAVVSGGTPPYSYLWDTGETTSSIAAGAGTHTVSVTDQSACVIAQASITIAQTPVPTVNAGADIDLCAGFIGSVTLNGTATNTSGIVWSGGSGNFADSTALSTDYYPTPAEIAGGLLTLVLMSNDASGCPPVSDDLSVAYNYVGESVALFTTNVTCSGLSDGTVAVSVTGVNDPYSFSFDSGPVTALTSASGLSAGDHAVTIINGVGCDSTLIYTILAPAPLVLSLQDQQNVSCAAGNDGFAVTATQGGVPPYQYSWNTTPVQSTPGASNLAAGTYTLTVTDQNGCVETLTVPVTEPAPLSLALSAVPPSCYGSANGALTATVSGGAGGYSYLWSGGQNAVNVYNVGAGNYAVTVTDSNGCTIAGNIGVSEPPPLVAVISNDTVVCPGSPFQLNISASGGTGTYQYQWLPGGQLTPAINTSTFTPQLYSCVVTDNNGCSVSQDVQVNTESMDPDDLTAQASPSTLCLGESSILTASYTGTDPSVVLSWQQCPSCPAQTTVTPSATTTYTVTATNYCGQTLTELVQVNVNTPPAIDLQPNSGLLCPGELLQFFNAGTNSPVWEYIWTFGDGNTSSQPAPQHAYGDAGIYLVSLTVTDANGCSTTIANGATVTVNPQAEALFTASSTSESILDPVFSFDNNSQFADAYTWTFGDGTSATTFNAVHTYTDFGSFEVQLYATNAYNCPDSTTLTIEVRPSFDIYIPNAFTPDGDQFNGLFGVQGYGLKEEDFRMEIFDRWGEIIYESADIYAGWNGTYHNEKVVQDGVYTWVVYFRDLTDEKHRVEGHVVVLR